MRLSKKQVVLYTLGVFGIGVVLFLWQRYATDGPGLTLKDNIEHFKYGSIGAEVNGLPSDIWRVLPDLFPDKLPGGYPSLGFIMEPGHDLPVGVSIRKFGIDRVGFNCATCHTTTINGKGLVLGAPAVRLDLGRYVKFLIDCATDERFTADNVLAALAKAGIDIPFYDKLFYRFVLIGKIRDELSALEEEDAWMAGRTEPGPGRGDAAVGWRKKWGLAHQNMDYQGIVDFPSLWNQDIRAGMALHWDGNNNSLDERNLSAAMAGGASEESLDHASIERVAAWSRRASAPAYPFAIDAARSKRGGLIYAREGCGTCHDADGARYGEQTPIAEIDTDPERWRAFTSELLALFNKVGAGRTWEFNHYRKSNGYANAPLDGIWARAPYLHNGSVPTLWDLLTPPEQRPTSFARGSDTYDSEKVGFKSDGPFLFETTERGNGNGGHDYGTNLGTQERIDLIEYLKTQ